MERDSSSSSQIDQPDVIALMGLSFGQIYTRMKEMELRHVTSMSIITHLRSQLTLSNSELEHLRSTIPNHQNQNGETDLTIENLTKKLEDSLTREQEATRKASELEQRLADSREREEYLATESNNKAQREKEIIEGDQTTERHDDLIKKFKARDEASSKMKSQTLDLQSSLVHRELLIKLHEEKEEDLIKALRESQQHSKNLETKVVELRLDLEECTEKLEECEKMLVITKTDLANSLAGNDRHHSDVEKSALPHHSTGYSVRPCHEEGDEEGDVDGEHINEEISEQDGDAEEGKDVSTKSQPEAAKAASIECEPKAARRFFRFRRSNSSIETKENRESSKPGAEVIEQAVCDKPNNLPARKQIPRKVESATIASSALQNEQNPGEVKPETDSQNTGGFFSFRRTSRLPSKEESGEHESNGIGSDKSTVGNSDLIDDLLDENTENVGRLSSVLRSVSKSDVSDDDDSSPMTGPSGSEQEGDSPGLPAFSHVASPLTRAPPQTAFLKLERTDDSGVSPPFTGHIQRCREDTPRPQTRGYQIERIITVPENLSYNSEQPNTVTPVSSTGTPSSTMPPTPEHNTSHADTFDQIPERSRHTMFSSMSSC